jgi:hypothetical protein
LGLSNAAPRDIGVEIVDVQNLVVRDPSMIRKYRT